MIGSYLKIGDVIYWLDSNGQRCGPATIKGFLQAGMDADNRPVMEVDITPVTQDGIEFSSVALTSIIQRTSSIDNSVMRFRGGDPVN